MKAVDEGAALLDERLPGWRAEVNPARLNLEYACGCVLGQLFGDYERGLRILGITTDSDARKFGFFRRGGQTWQRLTDAWREKIAA